MSLLNGIIDGGRGEKVARLSCCCKRRRPLIDDFIPFLFPSSAVMTERRFAGDWPWAMKTITCSEVMPQEETRADPTGSPVFSPDCKVVSKATVEMKQKFCFSENLFRFDVSPFRHESADLLHERNSVRH